GQLAVQEGCGIGAVGANDAPMRQRNRAVDQGMSVHAPIIISAHRLFCSRVSALRSLMKLWRVLLWLVVFAAIGAAAATAWWLNQPLPLAGETAEVDIEAGATPRDIAQGWVQAGVKTSPLLLYHWFRWSGQDRKIRAGSYEIGAGTTPISLLNKMVRGDQTLAFVRLIEGWTFRQFRAELAKAEGLKPTTSAMSDADVMAALGEPGLGDKFDGNLRKRDLLADSPYNTYLRAGLPPTPIAMPCKASLMAAVRPESTRALYFASRGDGSSEFSESLPAHNRAVNQYHRGK